MVGLITSTKLANHHPQTTKTRFRHRTADRPGPLQAKEPWSPENSVKLKPHLPNNPNWSQYVGAWEGICILF